MIDQNKFPVYSRQYVDLINNKFRNGDFVTICNDRQFCALVDDEHAGVYMQGYSWNLHFTDPSERISEYDNKFLHLDTYNDGITPFVYQVESLDERPPYYYIDNDFLALYKLFPRYGEYKEIYYVQVNVACEETIVIKVEGSVVSIREDYLLEYLAIKQLNLLLFFDYIVYDPAKLEGEPQRNIVYSDKDTFFIYCDVEPTGLFQEEKSGGWFMGKVIYRHNNDIRHLWDPIDDKYEDFIVGVKENGELEYSTCEEDKLTNLFNYEGKGTYTLTPVYFDREVLNRYIQNPDRYSVRDGYLSAPSWMLKMDNDRADNNIAVFLVDLGRIPYAEQQHWKKYNVIPKGLSLSKTAVARNIIGLSTNAQTNPAHVFKQQYIDLNQKWEAKYGWPIFLPFGSPEENEEFQNLDILNTDNNFKELKCNILTITKSVVDSLNEFKIIEAINTMGIDTTEYLDSVSKKIGKELKNVSDICGGINRLECLLITTKNEDVEFIKTLRNIQEFRSGVIAHREHRDSNKARNTIGLDKYDHRTALNLIYIELANGFARINNAICKP